MNNEKLNDSNNKKTIFKVFNNKKLNNYKESLRLGMIKNFEKNGHLAPILFFLKDNAPVIIQIPSDFLSTQESKVLFGNSVRRLCQEPNVMAAGMIIEAWGVKLHEDNEMSKLLMNGNMKVRDVKDRQDIIIMIFSTPEGEETISYVVDCENKTVGEKFIGEDAGKMGGNFSNFFNWTKN
jgi:hypothetical protein